MIAVRLTRLLREKEKKKKYILVYSLAPANGGEKKIKFGKEEAEGLRRLFFL